MNVTHTLVVIDREIYTPADRRKYIASDTDPLPKSFWEHNSFLWDKWHLCVGLVLTSVLSLTVTRLTEQIFRERKFGDDWTVKLFEIFEMDPNK